MDKKNQTGNMAMQMFDNAKELLYNHVGFVEDWTVYAIDNRMSMYWQIIEGEVKFAETMKSFNSDGDYYLDEIYTQRFYEKHVFRGSQLTMIIVDTHTDGNKFFAFFDNDKEVKESNGVNNE